MTSVALNRFAGATAVVTGAGSGIGRATALRLADAGLNVAALDVRAEQAERTAQDVVSRGPKGLGFGVDVTDAGAMSSVAGTVAAQLGVPRIVVASAGVSLRPLRPIWEN